MIKYILFDLDDTLYPTSAGMMQEISVRMSAWMIARLGVPADDVDRQRQDYWARYGTTLRGLYIERRIDPQDFLDYVHDIRIEKYLRADARLDAMLARLPQTKAIFTNAPADYARRVLRALDVEKHFAEIFDINFIAYQSKPAQTAYEQVVAALPVRAEECLIVEDTARNLVPAKKLGMKTVWLDGGNNRHGSDGKASADFIIQTIYEVEKCFTE
ncbi:MAG: pyrimidine 5'-nucleotidase [Chloroflexota bacterium]